MSFYPFSSQRQSTGGVIDARFTHPRAYFTLLSSVAMASDLASHRLKENQAV